MIVVTGSILAKPDTLEDLKRMGLEHSHRSRAEPGCLSHDLHVDVEDPMKLVFVERWADIASLKAHFMVPASSEFVKTATAMSAGPTSIDIYDARALSRRDIMA